MIFKIVLEKKLTTRYKTKCLLNGAQSSLLSSAIVMVLVLLAGSSAGCFLGAWSVRCLLGGACIRALGVAVVAVVVAGVAICWEHVAVVVAGGVAVVWVHAMIGAGQTGGRTEEGTGEFATGSENGKKTGWSP